MNENNDKFYNFELEFVYDSCVFKNTFMRFLVKHESNQ